MAKTVLTKPEKSLFAKDGKYATHVAYYRIWFDFLAMSPSYELARKFNSGEWSDEDEAKRPADFERVLKVYADLGDVQRLLFRDWWLNQAFDAFGYQGKKPLVQKVAYVAPWKDRDPHFGAAADQFIDGPWNETGRQRTLIVAIPIGLTRNLISRHINNMLDQIPAKQRTLWKVPAKYRLQATNLHHQSYMRYLSVLWHRCQFPDDQLWKIGARAKVSRTYSHRLHPKVDNDSHRLDPKVDNGQHDEMDDKVRLKILTHRAIERGKMMAENAARGVFPSYKKCPHAISFDLEELKKLWRDRRRWQRAERKRRKLLMDSTIGADGLTT